MRALDGLSLDIAPGELVALLGPSGCGKTTALRILAGFETADTGSVTVDGRDISPVPAAKRDMGMVFQSYSLFPNMTALDNVGFGLRMRKLRAAERSKRAAELLDMVGLTDQARKYPHQMSGGQQQRVALARALAIEPRVLLLDEPLSALDAKVRLQLREQIRSLQQRLGTTTLFVTHDQEEALSMADRVGVMRDGRLEQIAAPGELYAEPATAFVAEFVGTMNRIPGQLQGQDQVSALGAVVPVHGDTAAGLPADVDVLVRPEGLRIAVQPGGNGIVTDRDLPRLGDPGQRAAVRRRDRQGRPADRCGGHHAAGDVSAGQSAGGAGAGHRAPVTRPLAPLCRPLPGGQAVQRERRRRAAARRCGRRPCRPRPESAPIERHVGGQLPVQRGEVVRWSAAAPGRRPGCRGRPWCRRWTGYPPASMISTSRVWHGQSTTAHVVTSQNPRAGSAGSRPGADRVGVRVPVQPQHHVAEPVQQGDDLGGAEQRLAAPAQVRPGCWSACRPRGARTGSTSRSSWPVRTSRPSGPR